MHRGVLYRDAYFSTGITVVHTQTHVMQLFLSNDLPSYQQNEPRYHNLYCPPEI